MARRKSSKKEIIDQVEDPIEVQEEPKEEIPQEEPKEEILEETPELTPKGETIFTFTREFTVKIKVMTEAEIAKEMETWSEKETLGLIQYREKREAEVLRIWGGPGVRKSQILLPNGEVRKVWYYEKYGWSEA